MNTKLKNKDQVINLLNNIAFNDLKTNYNPWLAITDNINQQTGNSLTTSECVDIYQKNNNTSLFIKASNTNTKLLSYLENKTVALIGPAPYLIGQKKGAIIDQYDIVVRIQHGIPNEIDYGSRTDIIQSCLNINYGPPLVKYLQTLSEDKKSKFIICNDTASEPKANGQWAFVDEVYEKQFTELGIPLVHLHNSDGTWDRWALYWEMYPKAHTERFPNGRTQSNSENFNSGYGAINMILRYPVKELAAFGLDFYNTGVPQDDKGKYNSQYTDTYGKSGTPFGPCHGLHDQLSQMMHCKNVLMRDPRFVLDEDVKSKLMSENVANRIANFVKLPKKQNETR